MGWHLQWCAIANCYLLLDHKSKEWSSANERISNDNQVEEQTGLYI